MGNKASALPYDVGEKVCSLGAEGWTLLEGKRKRDGEPVSVFRFDKKSASPRGKEMAENFVKRLKILRHPHVLGYMDGLDVDSEVVVVTEAVVPLHMWLESMENESAEKRKMAIGWGFYCILQAVGFVNVDCKLAHGNISLESILVTKGGDWKLGGFFVTGEMGSDGPSKLFRDSPDVLDAKYKPAERLQNKWGFMSPTGIDTWALGCVLYESFNGKVYSAEDFKRGPGSIPSQLHKVFEAMLSMSPDERPDAKKLHASPGFKYLYRNQLVSTLRFLDEFQLKSDTERVPFVQSLNGSVDSFPRATCCYKIMPALKEAITFVSASSKPGQQGQGSLSSMILQPFLKIGDMIEDEEDYQRLVTPVVVDLFSSNDRATRVALLQKLKDIIPHMDEKLVNAKIFTSLSSGFDDTVPILRELTVKSVVLLAPKLSSSNLNEVLLRHLIKVLKDVEPAIRTNTLICLGKILPSFNDETKKRVVCGPFLQAIRDAFVPARTAALRSLASALQNVELDAQTLAGKIVPGLAFALVDPSIDVRNQAFAVMEDVMSRLKTLSEERAVVQRKEEEERKKESGQKQMGEIRASSSASSTSSSGAAANASDAASSYFSAAAGWAVGSLSKTFTSSSSSSSSSSTTAASSTATPVVAAPTPPAATGSQAVKEGWDADDDLLTGDGAWGADMDDLDDLGTGNDGWGAGGDDGGWGELEDSLSSTKPRKVSGHVKPPSDPDDLFNSLMAESSSTKSKPSLAAKKLGVPVAGSTTQSKQASAEKKREEARKRIAQRKEAKASLLKAKPAQQTKSSGDGDDWDNW